MRALLSRVLQRATRSDIVPEVDPKLLRSTDEPIIWADCTKLKLATRWEPAISLEQTIDDRLSWRQKPERALVVSRLRSIPTTLERCGPVPSDEGTPRPDRTRLFTAPAGNSELVAMSVLCRRP